MDRRASSISEFKINEMYPEDWKHNPKDWADKDVVFSEDPAASLKLNELVNARGNCKNWKE